MDEALQETYLNAYRGLPRPGGEAGVGTWLYRIAYTTCLQRLRRPPRLEPTDDERLEALTAPSPDLADDVASRDEVRRALGALTPGQRVAVLLIHHDGFSYADAAEYSRCRSAPSRPAWPPPARPWATSSAGRVPPGRIDERRASRPERDPARAR